MTSLPSREFKLNILLSVLKVSDLSHYFVTQCMSKSLHSNRPLFFRHSVLKLSVFFISVLCKKATPTFIDDYLKSKFTFIHKKLSLFQAYFIFTL